MKNQRLVITGGAGFIGSNLAQELSNDNDLIIIDDLSTGRLNNIKSLTKKANIKFLRGSILDLQFLKENFYGVDYVFHLAAIPSVPRSIKDPLLTNMVNITGTLNVLVSAKKNKVKKVIYSSSSSVYGNTPTLPKTEDMSPNPQSPYALTKMAGEYYCHIFTNVYQLPTVCLRYFNVYGPRQDFNSNYAAVVIRFISRLSQDKSPIIYGDGNQTRDFTFVKDAVQANIVAANNKAFGVFNVGTGNNISINTLSEAVNQVMGKNKRPIYSKPRPGDITDSLADITKIKALGYNPKYSINNGLTDTRRWFENEK